MSKYILSAKFQTFSSKLYIPNLSRLSTRIDHKTQIRKIKYKEKEEYLTGPTRFNISQKLFKKLCIFKNKELSNQNSCIKIRVLNPITNLTKLKQISVLNRYQLKD